MKTIKKTAKKLSILLSLLFVLSSLQNVIPAFQTVQIAEAAIVKLNFDSLTLTNGQTKLLYASNSKNEVKATWKSSDKKVAVYNKADKKVEAVGLGNATITATVGETKLTCEVQVKESGDVIGKVTYYTDFEGNVSDISSYVMLIPTDGSLKNRDCVHFDEIFIDINFDYNNLISTVVDATGEYILQDVPVGEYIEVIISKNTTNGDWFEYGKDDVATDINNEVCDFLSDSSVDKLIKDIGLKNYTIKKITVTENNTTNISHDFGITYL